MIKTLRVPEFGYIEKWEMGNIRARKGRRRRRRRRRRHRERDYRRNQENSTTSSVPGAFLSLNNYWFFHEF
jgi:hypothetical protein